MADFGTLVRIADVHKTYSRGSERVDVLQGVNTRHPEGRLPRAHGAVRVGQDDAAQPDRRPRHADPAAPSRSAATASTCRAALSQVARAAHRLRLPALQPDAGADRRAQRRAAAAADRCRRPSGASACPDRARPGRPGRPREHYPRQLSGRPGAARRHRPRDRHRPDAAALRRADRRPRPQVRRRDPRPAAGAQPRARQDHRDGHARPARRRARQADAAPRQGRAGRKERPA